MLNFLSIHGIRNRFRLILNDNSWKGVLDNKWFFHLHFSSLAFRCRKPTASICRDPA